MKSLRIASFVSALCALWLPIYAEETPINILSCVVENPTPGSLEIMEVNTSKGTISSTKLQVNNEIIAGSITIRFTITDADGNVITDQTNDICNMGSLDIFQPYFQSFVQSGFEKCNIATGTFISGKYRATMDDGPKGKYKATVEVKEGSDQTSVLTCEAEI